MKKLAGFILIIFGILLLLSSLPFIFSFSKKSTGEKEISAPVQSLNEIYLKSTSANWNIKTYEGEQLIVQLENPGRREGIHVHEQNDQLNIEVKEQGFRFFSINFWRGSSFMTVLVPQDYENELTIQTVSGDIELAGESTLTDVHVKTTSGDLHGMNIKGDTMMMSTVSGDIYIKQLDAEKLVVNSTSGNLSIDEIKGGLEGETVSGDIWIEFESENKETSLKTTSGDVGVRLPSGNADVTMKSTSGDIMANLELIQQSRNSRHLSGKIGNGDYPFTISTTSGDIIIN